MSKEIIFPKILMLGDSQTQKGYNEDGWVSKLSSVYVRRCDIVNRGFSGYTTRSVLKLLPHISFLNENAIAVCIFLGSNDSAIPPSKQHVPLSEFTANLTKIVHYFNQKIDIDMNNIILITPPPYDLEAYKDELRDNCVVNNYRNACVKSANKLGVPCVDLYSAIMGKEKWQSYLLDGLHLGKPACNMLSELLTPIFDRILAAHPMLFPYHKDLDENFPEETINSWLFQHSK